MLNETESSESSDDEHASNAEMDVRGTEEGAAEVLEHVVANSQRCTNWTPNGALPTSGNTQPAASCGPEMSNQPRMEANPTEEFESEAALWPSASEEDGDEWSDEQEDQGLDEDEDEDRDKGEDEEGEEEDEDEEEDEEWMEHDEDDIDSEGGGGGMSDGLDGSGGTRHKARGSVLTLEFPVKDSSTLEAALHKSCSEHMPTFGESQLQLMHVISEIGGVVLVVAWPGGGWVEGWGSCTHKTGFGEMS
jgi:hypothetical protein